MPALEAPPQTADAADDRRDAEAARYAVMRRIAPTLRHHMDGEFQPLTLLAALVERNLKTGAVDKATENSLSLGLQSRLANRRCASLLDWAVMSATAPSPAGQALQDCARLLGAVLSLRGFGLKLHAHELSMPLGPGLWRCLLPAALLYLSDRAQTPGRLHLRSRADGAQTLIEIRLEMAQQPAARMPAPERPIRWDDVCALARAEGWGLQMLPNGLRLSMAIGSRAQESGQAGTRRIDADLPMTGRLRRNDRAAAGDSSPACGRV